MKLENRKLLGIFEFLLKKSTLVIFFNILIYFIFDIFTSPQTYHVNADRTISQILLFTLMFLSLFFSIMSFFVRREKISISSLLLYFFWCCLILLPLLNDLIRKFTISYNTIKLSIYPATFMCVFLYLSVIPNECLDKKKIVPFFWVFVVLISFLLLFYFYKVRGTPFSNLNYRSPILSHVYLLVGLIPIAYTIFNFKKFFVFLLYICFCVFLSDKGTPIISIFFILMIFFVDFIVKKKKEKIFCIAAIFLGALVILILVIDSFVLNYKILSIIFDDSIKIRINGYITIAQELSNFSFIEILFGKGCAAVIDLRNLAAHNDFFEYLYDYGVVGLICFCAFLFFLIKIIRKSNKTNSFISIYLLDIILSFIIPITLFSAIFTNTNLTLFIAIALSVKIKNQSVKQIKEIKIYDQIFI